MVIGIDPCMLIKLASNIHFCYSDSAIAGVKQV